MHIAYGWHHVMHIYMPTVLKGLTPIITIQIMMKSLIMLTGSDRSSCSCCDICVSSFVYRGWECHRKRKCKHERQRKLNLTSAKTCNLERQCKCKLANANASANAKKKHNTVRTWSLCMHVLLCNFTVATAINVNLSFRHLYRPVSSPYHLCCPFVLILLPSLLSSLFPPSLPSSLLSPSLPFVCISPFAISAIQPPLTISDGRQKAGCRQTTGGFLQYKKGGRGADRTSPRGLHMQR